MGMIKYLASGFALVAVLLTAQPASAAPKKSFSAFKGTYTGSATLSTSGSFGTGNVTATISVPKNGRSASVAISGVLVVNGSQAYPLVSTISLKNGAASLSDVVLGLGSGTVYPGAGSYTLNSPKAVSFTAVNATNGFLLNGTAKLSAQGKKKQKITFSLVLSTGSSPLFITFDVKGKAPKLPN